MVSRSPLVYLTVAAALEIAVELLLSTKLKKNKENAIR